MKKLLLITLLGLLAVPAAAAAQAPPPGPPELDSASLAVATAQLTLVVKTKAPLQAAALAVPNRSLCLELLGPSAPDPTTSLCFVPKGRRLALAQAGSTDPVKAAIGRPDANTVQARFTPAVAGLKGGQAFRWRVVARSEAGSTRVPESGANDAKVPDPVAVGCEPRGASFRTNGPRNRKVVALTFDDGPAPITRQFLDTLKREGIHGTFFMIGQQVGGQGALLKRMLREGNVIANHSWNHANLGGGGAGAMSQLRRTNAAIKNASGYTPCLFRAPYGSVGGSLISGARSMGMLTIQWDVDPTDYATPGAGVIASRVLSQTHPGSIILMHDGGGPRGQSLSALSTVISTLKSRGYKFATVPELLGLAPKFA